MWWKIYFWINVVFFTIGILVLIPQLSKFSLGDWMSIISNFILMFGLYIYVFKRTDFKKDKLWKNIFVVNFIFLIFTGIDFFLFSESLSSSILPAFKSNLDLNKADMMFTLMFSIPAFYANFKLAFGKSKK